MLMCLSLGDISNIICSAIAIILTLQDQKGAIITTTHCYHLLAPLAFNLTHFSVALSVSRLAEGLLLNNSTEGPQHTSPRLWARRTHRDRNMHARIRFIKLCCTCVASARLSNSMRIAVITCDSYTRLRPLIAAIPLIHHMYM